ncbi:MAG: alpha-amylase, partial [Candidatus Thiodiazotropha sp. (ex Notomyrtea botanica)]|nr:alpha-amylase [Candidatus Thiodiazotropha sp. (ex Notomyrtea botanica)]
MYEQVSHSLLNRILDELKPDLQNRDLRHFYTRLGANFYAIYTLFYHLYGQREDFRAQIVNLVEVMATRYVQRHAKLRHLDEERETDHNWFLSQEWVGMALYADGFAGNLEGVRSKLPYLQELGVNMLHVMPVLVCP